jgi:tRNA nucleotidyltransferase (CCA-adding enzyme)
MATIAPPKYVRQILFTLQGHGYPAYLVGGCVRDMLLEHRPHDWDICTGALPEQVMALFPGSRPTGLAHGTVTVVIGSRQVEVTTFRTEGSYADHRHPDRVAFVTELTEDLSRRDFTMNAIALAADGLLADPFGGVEDIREKRIRCVGEPALRFEEDALRMLRALRFSAKLGFTIEINTLLAIQEKAPLAATLAAERVREELEKLLLTDAPETVHPLMEMGLLDAYLLDRPLFSPLFRKLRRLPRKALYRWAGLAVLLCRLGCIDSAEDFLRSLRLDSRSIRCCTAAEQLLRQPLPTTPLAWKKALHAWEVPGVSCAAAVSDALYGGQSLKELRAVLRSGECFSLKHLAVSGDDLLALGLRGRALGEMLNFLLDYVMEYPENNRRELLLSLAGGGSEE